MDKKNYLGGATTFGSSLKVHKTPEEKEFLLLDWFNTDKMQNTEFPPCDVLCSRIRSFNLLEAEDTKIINLVRSGMTALQAPAKLKLSKPPLTRLERRQNLQET